MAMHDAQHQFSITSSFQNVSDLAEKVSSICKSRSGIDSDAADALRLCIAEALNNIVEHAYGGIEGKPIYANLRFMPEGYEVMLIDEGKPMPGGQIPDTMVNFDESVLEDLPEGGFGWMLIRDQMDSIDYERRDGCNVLRLCKAVDV
ncbi:MAG: ATP-binding protein [Pseudomonadota bacterium]